MYIQSDYYLRALKELKLHHELCIRIYMLCYIQLESYLFQVSYAET